MSARKRRLKAIQRRAWVAELFAKKAAEKAKS